VRAGRDVFVHELSVRVVHVHGARLPLRSSSKGSAPLGPCANLHTRGDRQLVDFSEHSPVHAHGPRVFCKTRTAGP
jgi:hypothetical protein